MIGEVDEALCRVLARVLPKGAAVRLDPPKPTWQTETPSRAVDLFLFGLAGDRRPTPVAEQPARRFLLSYLVTARAPDIAQEHELLDIALRALTDRVALADSCLPAALVELGLPVTVELDPAGPGALWPSLGMPARAGFVLAVSAPQRAGADLAAVGPLEPVLPAVSG